MARCPGCKLEMPSGDGVYAGDFNCSVGCWSVFTEVLASEYQDMLLFGEIHQLTVDAYAAQHAGGRHRDKSVCVHLVGLHLVIERGLAPTDVPPRLQRLVGNTTDWPHYTPPLDSDALTVFDVALTPSRAEHAARVREWSRQVWTSWKAHHAAIAQVAERCYAANAR